MAINDRSIVLDQTLKRLPSQIEAVEGRIASLKIGHNPKRLRIVIEAAEAGQAFVERAFARMAERRMAEIVRQRQRFAEVLVEAKGARQRARDLRDFQRMRQPRAVVVSLVIDEDLRLVGQPAECGRMDDAVAVAAEDIAGRARRLRIAAAAALRRIGGINCPLAMRLSIAISTAARPH